MTGTIYRTTSAKSVQITAKLVKTQQLTALHVLVKTKSLMETESVKFLVRMVTPTHRLQESFASLAAQSAPLAKTKLQTALPVQTKMTFCIMEIV